MTYNYDQKALLLRIEYKENMNESHDLPIVASADITWQFNEINSYVDCSSKQLFRYLIYLGLPTEVVKNYTVGIKYVSLIFYPTRDSNGEKRTKAQVQ
jgi:hypothetical protein